MYLIADSLGGDQAPVAALFAALVSEIRFQAAQLGSFQQRGRLDPPLFMALDEAPQICPVPVPAWVADSGGKGVSWPWSPRTRRGCGSGGAATARRRSGTAAPSRSAWAASTTRDTLGALSTLCGTGGYDQQGRRRGEAGQPHLTQHPVMAPDMIRRIPRLYALLLWGDYCPVIGHVPRRVAGAAVPAGRARRHRRGEGSARRGGPARSPCAGRRGSPSRPADRAPQDTVPVGAGDGNGHGSNGNGHGPAGGGAGA